MGALAWSSHKRFARRSRAYCPGCLVPGAAPSSRLTMPRVSSRVTPEPASRLHSLISLRSNNTKASVQNNWGFQGIVMVNPLMGNIRGELSAQAGRIGRTERWKDRGSLKLAPRLACPAVSTIRLMSKCPAHDPTVFADVSQQRLLMRAKTLQFSLRPKRTSTAVVVV
jgi:hypothetical protein